MRFYAQVCVDVALSCQVRLPTRRLLQRKFILFKTFVRLCTYVTYLFRHHVINTTAFKKNIEKKTDEFCDGKANGAHVKCDGSGCAVGQGPFAVQVQASERST